MIEQHTVNAQGIDTIVEHNLKLMTELSSREDGTLMGCVMNESLGGNAGVYQKYVCAGAHFLYDSDGKILHFGVNPRDEQVRLSVGGGILRVAVLPMEFPLSLRIVEVYSHSIDANPKDHAVKIVLASIAAYNDRYAFSMENP